MNSRRVLCLCAALSSGFFLGARFSRQVPVHAQSGLKIYIKDDSSPGLSFTAIPSTQIVGFSCIEERVGSVGSPRCYIAYVQ
jgi:hypothetical protein